ncbi:hypothetical protein GBA52_022190 [Prunus armeniaca]|nr:hypothetical protein GBA52_022190 [Prunus armeniaca]
MAAPERSAQLSGESIFWVTSHIFSFYGFYKHRQADLFFLLGTGSERKVDIWYGFRMESWKIEKSIYNPIKIGNAQTLTASNQA